MLVLSLFFLITTSTSNFAYASISAPTATSSVTNDVNGFDELDSPNAVTTVVIGGNTYALVANNGGAGGVQIINITDPTNPTATASVTEGVGGFNELTNAHDITAVQIGTSTYALVAAQGDDGVQIINITTPTAPTVTANIEQCIFPCTNESIIVLESPRGITTVVIGTSTYALVASSDSNGVQIINITDPAVPTAAASIFDGAADGNGILFDELAGAYDVTTVVIGGNTYALVAANGDNGVQIINITDPANPTATASVTDDATFTTLAGAYDIKTVAIGGNTYALVVANGDDGVQIIDITDPANPTATASITDELVDGNGNTFTTLSGPTGVSTVVIGLTTYALVASQDDNGVQIIDISTPSAPTAVASITDGSADGSGGTFDRLNSLFGITTVTINSTIYALAASSGDGIQIINIHLIGGSSNNAVPPSYSINFDANEYPISIDNTKLTFAELGFNNPTTTIEIGKPVVVNLLIHDNEGPSYIHQVELYTNLTGPIRNAGNSDTSIIYSQGNPPIVTDPNGFFSNVVVSSSEVNQKLQITYEITFAKEMEKSDILIQARDKGNNTAVMSVFNAWEIISESTTNTTETPAVESTDTSVSGKSKVKTLNAEKSQYYRNEEVVLSGTVDGYNSGTIVSITFRTPASSLLTFRTAFVDKDGNFEIRLDTNNKFKTTGTYSATAFTDDPDDRGMYTEFSFSLSAPPSPTVITSPPQSTQSESTVSEPITPKPKAMPSFVDPEKDPHYYIDRYNNEVIYKEWFDENYSNYTIKEAVGIPESIPEWVKDNALGWAEGQTDESDFVSGIKHMINEKIIYLPDLPSQASTSKAVPDWIKNNAKWWAGGQIDEDTFADGIKYLVEQGIIQVN